MDIAKLVWPPKEKCRMDATFFVSGVYENQLSDYGGLLKLTDYKQGWLVIESQSQSDFVHLVFGLK